MKGADTSMSEQSFPTAEQVQQQMGEGITDAQPPVSDEPATPDQTGVETESAETAEEVFYDASKVPPELQASFKAMQAAWTKKAQEAAAYRRFSEYGDPEQVAAFLDSLRTPEGILDWWQQVANRLGITEEQVAALFDGEAQERAGVPSGDDLDRPLTVREWQQMKEEERVAAQQAAENQEVVTALQEHGVSKEMERFVLAAAYTQPRHLGYSERIRRGKEAFEKALQAQSAQAAEAEEKNRGRTPKSLTGGSPASGSEKTPKTLEEARNQAEDYLNAVERAGSL